MSHPKARLTFHGRLLLVQRVLEQQWPVAHAAKAQGVSRQCAHRWINRYRAQGAAGLHDRSSAPRRRPTRTTSVVERQVVALRVAERRGSDWIAAETGVPARTVSRILRRHGMPYLNQLDPLTGVVIRASKTTAVRYEHPHPGSLVHTDVKKIGRIPDGGGWRVHGRTEQFRGRGIGYDFVHSVVDDHSPLRLLRDPARRDRPHHRRIPRPGSGRVRHRRDHRRETHVGQPPVILPLRSGR